jgi:hypothetical protein
MISFGFTKVPLTRRQLAPGTLRRAIAAAIAAILVFRARAPHPFSGP